MLQAAWAWLHFHTALIEDGATGNAGPGSVASLAALGEWEI